MDRKLANTARLSLVLSWMFVMATVGGAVYFGSHGQEALAAGFGVGALGIVVIAMLKGGGKWSGR